MNMATKNSQQSGSSIKQEREARRLEKVGAFKAKQARERRNRRIGAAVAIVGGLAVVALIVTAIVVTSQPKVDPTTVAIGDVQTFDGLAGSGHVDTLVDYEAEYGMNPPAGGVHSPTWLNCGVYTEPVPNENAVHALEHGAIWITYDTAALSASDIEKLQRLGTATKNQGYLVVSPYAGIPSPVVVSAWGFQLQLDDVNDPRLEQFIAKYLLASTAPEPGAACVGGVDGAGRIG